MLLRVPLALVFTILVSALTSLATYYDGIATIIFLPFMSACCGGASTFLAFILGSFLLIPKVWPHWRRYWPLSIVLFIFGAVFWVMSFDAAYMITVEHPEFTGETLDVPNPAMGMAGWLIMSTSIMYFPLVGFSADKKWY